MVRSVGLNPTEAELKEMVSEVNASECAGDYHDFVTIISNLNIILS